MKQGFSVFVMNWGDAGFKAIEVGPPRRESPTTQRLTATVRSSEFKFKVTVASSNVGL